MVLNNISGKILRKYKHDLDVLSIKYDQRSFNLFFPLLEIWNENVTGPEFSKQNQSGERHHFVLNRINDDDTNPTREYIRERLKNNAILSNNLLRRPTINHLDLVGK